MEFKIKGSERAINKFLRMTSLYMKRNGLALIKDVDVEAKGEVKLTANEVKELIEMVDNIDDLKQYESDKRQVVVIAYNKKLKELE